MDAPLKRCRLSHLFEAATLLPPRAQKEAAAAAVTRVITDKVIDQRGRGARMSGPTTINSFHYEIRIMPNYESVKIYLWHQVDDKLNLANTLVIIFVIFKWQQL